MSQENGGAEDLYWNTMEVHDPSHVVDNPPQQTESAASSSSLRSSPENPHQKLLQLNKQRVRFQEVTMKMFWEQITSEMEKIDSTCVDFNDQEISVKLMETMIRNEAIHLSLRDVDADRSAACALSKICELFVLEMAMRSNLSRQVSLQNEPLRKEDVTATIRDFELYDLFAEHL